MVSMIFPTPIPLTSIVWVTQMGRHISIVGVLVPISWVGVPKLVVNMEGRLTIEFNRDVNYLVDDHIG